MPDDDPDRAAAGLRRQLRLMATATGATPDWGTLSVEGPTEAELIEGRTWFEWRARVQVDGAGLDDEPELAVGRGGGVDQATAPFRAVG